MYTSNNTKLRHQVLPLAGLLLGIVAPLTAQTNSWNSTSGGNWSDISKWSLGVVPDGAGSDVVISQNIIANQSIVLNVDATVGNLTLEDTIKSNPWTLSGSNVLTFDNLGNGSTLTVINPSSGSPYTTISAPIALNDNLTIHSGFSAASGGTQGSLYLNGNINGNGKTLTVNGTSALNYSNASATITNLAGINLYNASTTDLLRPITNTGGFTLNQGVLTSAVTLGGTTNTTTLGGALTIGARGSNQINLQQSIIATDLVISGDGMQTKYYASNNIQGSPNNRNAVIMNNTVANAFSGNTTVTGALLHLDFGAAAGSNVTKINNSGTLTLNGATLIADDGSAAAATQSVASTTIGAGESNIESRRNNTQNITLNLGAITRQDGGTTVFRYADGGTIGTQNTITTTNAGTNGLLGGWAVLATSGTNVTDFAGVTGAGPNFVIAAPTYTTLAAAGINDITKNSLYASGTTLNLTGPVISNSLKIGNSANSGVLTINTGANNVTLNTGGLLIDNNGSNSQTNTVINGTGTIGGNTANDDFFVYVRNNRVTINNPVIGAGSGELYKSGFGMVSVTAPADYTGGTTIIGGILNVAEDQSRLSSGNLRLTNGGQLGASGSFTRSLGTGDGQVQFGVGGGGFSAQNGALTVNLGGAGATLTKADIGGNISLNNVIHSTDVVTLVNPIDVTGDVTISVGANVDPGRGRMQSNNGAAYAVLQGGTTGTGNLQVYGASSFSANINDSGHAGAGMLVPLGNLNHTGSIEVTGASLYVGDFSQLAGRNTLLYAGGQLAGYGNLTANLGAGDGEIQFQSTTFVRSGGFAAVGGPLTVNIGGAGAVLSDPDAVALGNAFSTHPLDFQNSLSSKTVKVTGPVPVTISGKLTGINFSLSSNSPTSGVLIATNPDNDFTGYVSVSNAIYKAGTSAAYGAAGGTNNGGTGTHDLNGFNFSSENFLGSANGQGPLGIPKIINSNLDSTAAIGNYQIGDLYGGAAYFGGPGNLEMNNFTGASTSGGTIAWRGTGTLTIKGNSTALTYGGSAQSYGMSFNGGKVVLDYAADTGNKLINGSSTTGIPIFALTQTNLELIGNASTPVTQTIPTVGASVTNITNGAAGVKVTTRGADVTFNLNVIQRNANATADFSKDQTAGGVASITSDVSNNTRGIIGGWATWNQTDWAVNSTNGADGAIAALSSGSYANKADVSTWVDSDHATNNSAGYTGTTNTVNLSSLRFNSPNASDINIASGQTLTIGDTTAAVAGMAGAQTTGILVTPAVGANTSTISGGTIGSIGNNNDIIFHQYNTQGDLVVNSVISGSTSSVMVKTGEGKLILNGANTNQAAPKIYAGIVEIPSVANSGIAQPLGSNTTLTMQGGATLRYTGGDAATNKRINLGVGGATLDASGSGTLTFDTNPSNTLNVYGEVYTASIARGADTDVPNLTLTGSGNAVVNGAIILTSPSSSTYYGDSSLVYEGFTQVTKNGTGEWTLNATNSWQGGTIINEGTLTLGHATDTLSNNGPVTINSGATLQVNALDNVGTLRVKGGTVSGLGMLTPMAVSGESGLVSANLGGLLTRLDKTTAGTLILSGNNTYAGGTVVSEGTLRVNNTAGSGTGSGLVSIQAGGILGGIGFIGGDTTIAGLLAPGNSAGTLTFNQDLTLQTGAKLQIEMGANALATDKVVVLGNLNATDGLTIDFKLLGLPAMGTEFNLISVAGTANYGTITFISSDSSYPNTWLQNSTYTVTNGNLLYTAVPEPATLAAIFGGLVLVFTLVYRRRQNR